METWLESIVAGLVSWCDGIPNRSWKESRVVRFFFRGDKSGQPEVGGIRALGRRKRMEADSPFRTVRSLVSFFTSFAFSFQSIHSDSRVRVFVNNVTGNRTRNKIETFNISPFIFILILSLFIIPSHLIRSLAIEISESR